MSDKLITCHFCDHPPFDSYKELAIHIIASKKIGNHGNKKSQAWAKKFLMRQEALDKKATFKKMAGGRVSVTDAQREAKESTVRELSGRTEYVKTKCPKCKTTRAEFVEIEHLNADFIWKEGDRIIIICGGCRR